MSSGFTFCTFFFFFTFSGENELIFWVHYIFNQETEYVSIIWTTTNQHHLLKGVHFAQVCLETLAYQILFPVTISKDYVWQMYQLCSTVYLKKCLVLCLLRTQGQINISVLMPGVF